MRHPSPFLLFAGLLPLSLAACATPASDGDGARVADGSGFTLQVGEQVRLADDSRLRYLRLVTDSRCPPDVQCVWAGDAIVALEWSPADSAAQAFELHTGKEPRSQALGGRTLVLESLARGAQPAATLKIEPAR